MKKKFSKKWKASKQPRKKRKYLANAPIHLKSKMMVSNLSKELRKKYKKRSIRVRKDDEIKILTGEFKGKTGKVISMNIKKRAVLIDGIQRTKKDGTKISVGFDPSNLQITALNTEDKKRNIAKKIIARGKE